MVALRLHCGFGRVCFLVRVRVCQRQLWRKQAALLPALETLPTSKNVDQLRAVLHGGTSVALSMASQLECAMLLALASGGAASPVEQLRVDRTTCRALAGATYLRGMPALRELEYVVSGVGTGVGSSARCPLAGRRRRGAFLLRERTLHSCFGVFMNASARRLVSGSHELE